MVAGPDDYKEVVASWPGGMTHKVANIMNYELKLWAENERKKPRSVGKAVQKRPAAAAIDDGATGKRAKRDASKGNAWTEESGGEEVPKESAQKQDAPSAPEKVNGGKSTSTGKEKVRHKLRAAAKPKAAAKKKAQAKTSKGNAAAPPKEKQQRKSPEIKKYTLLASKADKQLTSDLHEIIALICQYWTRITTLCNLVFRNEASCELHDCTTSLLPFMHAAR